MTLSISPCSPRHGVDVAVAVGAGVAVASAHAEVVKLAVSLVPLVTVFQENTFQ